MILFLRLGQKYLKLLNKLEIYTIADLLYHIPFRYEDYSKIVTISEIEPNQAFTIKATVQNVENIYTRYRKRLTKAKVKDQSGELELIWFNSHYIKKALTIGEQYYFSGKSSYSKGKRNVIAPVFETVRNNSVNTARLVPVYKETRGISSKWIRSKINAVTTKLEKTYELRDPLPKKIKKDEDFLSLTEALSKIHFPKDMHDVELAKTRLAFDEMFIELLKVENRRDKWNFEYEGVKIDENVHRAKIERLIESLPFALTDTQKDALSSINDDLDSIHPMNRLLEGDVGSGKTIVAVVASYLAHLAGYKTLYMAPTEILAQQHYESYSKFLKDFDVDVKLVTGSKKAKISAKSNDIIIGTHAILYSKEEIQNVGLIVVDEQHRFGVEQRAKIVTMGTKDKKPNLLTMTATPIPRTLALTLYGDLDISVLDSVPNKDKKITTKVIPEDMRQKAYKWIKAKKEQAFIVCPFIEESSAESLENIKAAQKEYENLSTGIFSDLKVGLLHGKMKAKEKQQVMNDFKNKKYQVLVSTPVIEVGVDIPDATIMVIESAERYGLASLHQLRGRVGRGNKEGFCLLFMTSFSRPSYERLKNLERTDNGIELAELDMKTRGHGDVIGTMQHGFKQFKVANLNDTKTIEKAKKWAKKLYPNLHRYPELSKEVDMEYNKASSN